jgi:hypothetical protein
MRKLLEVENIEEIRHAEGIDDVELRKEIGGLHAGDIIKLTLRAGTAEFETVQVRITSIKGSTFRGKLVSKPASRGLAEVAAGTPLVFASTQIHSVVQGRKVPEG